MALCIAIASSCNTTKHLKEGEYLLQQNNIEYKSGEYLVEKGELTDKLRRAIVQKPNSSFIIDGFKPKLMFYNMRYEKYKDDPDNYQLKSNSVEPPVLYDSTTIIQSKSYMKSYMFHQGYFYAEIEDTTFFNEKKKKAKVLYEVNTGINYLINRVFFENIADDTVKKHVRNAFDETFLRAGKIYSADLMDEERSRITNYLRDRGYYNFSKSNISFVLDTNVKENAKLKESVLKDAADIITNRENKRPVLDIYLTITNNEKGDAFTRYGINKIYVFPDFRDQSDVNDSTMLVKKIDSATFRYHDYYIRERVLYNHIFITTNTHFAQGNYDKTLTELNQLGAFNSVRIIYFEDTVRNDGAAWLNCAILMTPGKKYDFGTSWEASSGTTYTLGSGVTVSLRDNNVAKGANLLTFAINGGIESQYDTSRNNFFILTRTLGVNSSLEFPKFLFPISRKRYSIRNTPRTEVAVGANLLDRRNFFTLLNLTSRFTYKWRETNTKSWTVSPFFVNDISLENIDPNFQKRLEENEFLQNSYRQTFIEGESITWTYSDAGEAKWYDDYSYVKLGFEEAGALVRGLNGIKSNLTASYSQYLRLDYDFRHFIVQKHATTALRLYGGVGVPYGASQGSTLPYLKQYFVGGPFSMRGFLIRRLGPGSYVDSSKETINADPTTLFLDRTGDIKIELNGEYRFDIFKAFSGLFKFNGAIFGDAGNIWLFNKAEDYPNAEMNLQRFYKDIAVDGGLGIRMDIADLFVFRVDMAIPLKIPGVYSDPDKNIRQGWVLNDIDPLYNRWRRDNMIWNIAIGYPF